MIREPQPAYWQGALDGVRIRPLEPSDRKALHELASIAPLPSLKEPRLVDQLLDEGHVFGGWAADGALLACSGILRRHGTRVMSGKREVEMPAENVYLCAAFVRPDARGRGVGNVLYWHRLNFALHRFAAPIIVELLGNGTPDSVHPCTASGYRFHLRNGFVEIGYSGDPDGGKVLAFRLPTFTNLNGEMTVIQTNVNALLAARGMRDLPQARQALADTLLHKGSDPAIVEAMTSVPRHAFVTPPYVDYAYLDRYVWTPDTVLSTPSVVAQMLQALQLNPMKRVLEVGTGTGYQTAVLGLLAGQVFSIDRVPECIRTAKLATEILGINNVQIKLADGYEGWFEEQPFDAILLATAPPVIPPKLIEQLSPQHGRMVLPLGAGEHQRLTLVRRIGKQIFTSDLGPTYFVPMIPSASWYAVHGETEEVDLPSSVT